jgi:nardilysin
MPTGAADSGTLPSPAVTVLPSCDHSKTPYDLKNYRQIVLPNGLRAVLISDTRAMRDRDLYDDDESDSEDDEDDEDDGRNDMTDKSQEGSEEGSDGDGGPDSDEGEHIRFAACSLLAGVGSFSDPEHLPGLAHFLEHMLFMGTDAFPDENHYDAYVSKHGGETNAWTDLEETVYHFTVPQAQLTATLDIFSRFFYQPLMRADAVDREKQAVESEFQLAVMSDNARLQQLFCATAKPLDEHPFRTFSWGNAESLSPPGVDVVKELRTFYDMYYYAQNMRLVIIGGYSLDELQAMVVDKFSPIPAAPRVAPTLPIVHNADHSCTSPLEKFGLPFPPSSLQQVYYMLPIKHCHSLFLTFQLPPQHKHWRSLPNSYIGHLLGHEGKGSILSLIKQKGWASGIVAGVGEGGADNASSHCLFQVQVMMSEAGVAHVDDILEMIFSFIELLKSTYAACGNSFPPYIFNELKAAHAMAYNFASEEQPEEFVENLVTSLSPCRSFPPEFLLSGGELLFEEDATAVISILNKLTVESSRVDVMSSLWGVAADFQDVAAADAPPPPPSSTTSTRQPLPDHIAALPMQTEPIFGTKFWSTSLSSWLIAKLKAPAHFPGLTLPPPNPFIATNFEMRPFPPDDAAHPLLNASVKVAASTGKKNKFGTFYPATVTKFNEKKHTLTVIFEDEDSKEIQLDKSAHSIAYFKTCEEDSAFIADDGKSKVKIVAMVYEGEATSTNFRFGDGINDEDVEDDKSFPPIPPAPPPTRLPQIAFDSPSVRLHHLQDRLFNRPQSELRIKLMHSVDRSNPLEAACGDLLQMLVADAVTETVYMASVCELFYDMTHLYDGYFTFKFNGFSEKLPALADYVLSSFLSFREPSDSLPAFLAPNRFQTAFESLNRWYSNTNLKASSQVTDVRVRCLIKNKISENRKAAALENIDIPTFMRVVNKILCNISVEGLYHGNCDKEDAIALAKNIDALLTRSGGAPLARQQKPSDAINAIPSSSPRILIGSKNVTEPNNAVEHYFQMSSDPGNTLDRITIDLLTQIMYEPFFDQVRTKEQFGYSVSCGARWTGGVMGVTMKIVSAVKTVAECSDRIDKFLGDFRKILVDMKDDDYLSNVVSLAKSKLCAFDALGDHTSHLWSEITSCRLEYNCLLDEVKCLRGCKKDDLVRFYDKFLAEGGAGRKRLVATVCGGGGKGVGGGVDKESVSSDLGQLDELIEAMYAHDKRWPVTYPHK